MHCPRCHRSVLDGAHSQYCKHCGIRFEDAAAYTETPSRVLVDGRGPDIRSEEAPRPERDTAQGMTRPDATNEDLPVVRTPKYTTAAVLVEAEVHKVEGASVSSGSYEIDVDFEGSVSDASLDSVAQDSVAQDVADAVSDGDVSLAAPLTSEGAVDSKDELVALLSQITDESDRLGEIHKERRRIINDLDAVTDSGLVMDDEDEEDDGVLFDFSDEDDDGFAFGDSDVIADDGPFVLGDEEDSGPVPMMPDAYEATTRPPRGRRARRVRLSHVLARFEGVQQAVVQGAQRARKIPRRTVVIALIAMLAVGGIGYAIIAGEQNPESSEEAVAEATSPVDMSAAAQAGTVINEPGSEASYELVRLSTDEQDDPTLGEVRATAPVSALRGQKVAFSAQNVLEKAAIPAKTKKHTLSRACILREGPASRFKLIKPLATGDVMEVFSRSTEDWKTTTQGKLRGWAKGCTGSECTLRMGPGEGFRTVRAGDDMPVPSSRVTSSSKWRYVKVGNSYGWTGPVCFK